MNKEKKKVIITCLNCKKEFTTSKANKIKFCSIECRKEFYYPKKYTTAICLYCKKEFTLTIKALSKKKFCSANCRNNFHNKYKKENRINLLERLNDLEKRIKKLEEKNEDT